MSTILSSDARNLRRRLNHVPTDRSVQLERERQRRAALNNGGRGNYNFPQHHLGELDLVCEHCSAVHFQAERGKLLHSCCHNGKVLLRRLQNFPEELKDMLLAGNEQTKNYLKYIRSYNNAFAFASFGAKLEDLGHHGPNVFKICGQVYHRATASLYPVERPPSYGQIYVYVPEAANDFR
jgi:hypothetical protein